MSKRAAHLLQEPPDLSPGDQLEPSCLMVYGPGRYRFFDFVKVGALLTVLIYLVAIILVPMTWPLK